MVIQIVSTFSYIQISSARRASDPWNVVSQDRSKKGKFMGFFSSDFGSAPAIKQ
jgi:hypothetical protein